MKPAVAAKCSSHLKGNNRISILKSNMSDHDPGIQMHDTLKDRDTVDMVTL